MTTNTNLEQWQEQFTSSLFNDLSDELKTSFKTASDIASNQRFAIYKNNVFHSLTNALGDLYPVIKKLVGDDFFNGTAAFYLRQHPPQQAAMVHFAQDFPDFLETFEHTQTLTYLAPVARLELARHQAYHAQDCKPINSDYIGQIQPEALAESRFLLHPSLQLITSNQPIFDIWQSNQDGNNSEKNIQLNEPQQVLIVRPYYDVYTYKINLSTYHFVDHLLKGNTLQEAINYIGTAHSELEVDEADISQIIHFLLNEELIYQVQTPGE